MPQPNEISVSYRIGDGEYGQVIAEALSVYRPGRAGAADADPRFPPYDTPVLGSGSDAVNGNLQPPGRPGRGTHVFSNPWMRWLEGIDRFRNRINLLLRQTDIGGPLILFTAWSVREIDVEWWAEVPASPMLADHTTVTPTLTAASRFGQPLGYVTVDDPGSGYTQGSTSVDVTGDGAGAEAHAVVNDDGEITGVVVDKWGAGYTTITLTIVGTGTDAAVTGHLYPWAPGQHFLVNDETVDGDNRSYEICRIDSINYGTGEWTILRAQLGTTARDHATDANGQVRFYLLIPGRFQRILGPNPPPTVMKFLWDNMCVSVMQAQVAVEGAPVNTQRLFADAATTPARPGKRSMGGAAYINMVFSGDYVVGDTTNKADATQCWETLRYVQAHADVADSETTVVVAWIDKEGTAYWVGTVTIPAGETMSGESFGQQMPSALHVWPPNALIELSDALDAEGNLLPTATPVDGGRGDTQMKQDGYFQAVVIAGAGTNLRVVVQT